MFVAYACSCAFTVAVFVSVRWGVGLDLPDVPVNWGVKAIQVCIDNTLRAWTGC